MKKDTVVTLLNKSEREAQREKDGTLRKAQLNAIQQCRRWLDLAWADMLTPVAAKLEAITTETKPLLKQEDEQELSEEDTTRLQRARASYAIYYQFYQKIYPTAHRASVERSVREREKGEYKKKQTSHQP